MELWIAVAVLAGVVAGTCVAAGVRARRTRAAGVVLRIDVGQDALVPLTVVNAGRDPVFELEATLRFEPRRPTSGHVLERHRRARVLLPGERLAFALPEDMAGERAAELATLVRRVSLDAVGEDAAGRPVEARDVLDDPLTWMETERRSRPSAVGADVHEERPRTTTAR